MVTWEKKIVRQPYSVWADWCCCACEVQACRSWGYHGTPRFWRISYLTSYLDEGGVYYAHPRIFRHSYGPVVCYAAMQFMTYLQTTSWKNCPFQVKISKSAWQTFVNVANAHVMSICMDLATQSQSSMWAILGFRINVDHYTCLLSKRNPITMHFDKKDCCLFSLFSIGTFNSSCFTSTTNFSTLSNIGSGKLWRERMFNFKTFSQPDCTLI